MWVLRAAWGVLPAWWCRPWWLVGVAALVMWSHYWDEILIFLQVLFVTEWPWEPPPLQLLKSGTATGPWLYFIYDLMFDIKKGNCTLFCVAFILGCKVSIIYLHCHCTVGYDYLEVNTVTGNCIDFTDTEVKAHLRVVDVWILTRSPELRIPHSSMGLGLTTWHFVSLRSSSNSILQPPSTYRWK